MSVSEPGSGPDGGVEIPVGDLPLLCANVVTTDDGTEECTIFPEAALTVSRTEEWVAATDDSFVDLADVR